MRHHRSLRSRWAAAAFAVLALVVTGCSSTINVPALKAEEVATLDRAANFPHLRYTVEAGDSLHVQYTYHAELNQEVVVQPDGKIALLQAGEVPVSGLTTAEIEKRIVEKTATTLKEPQVVVHISKFAEKTVYIGGEVGKPGPIVYRRGLTPMQAIIAAGGFKETARMDSIILVRPGANDTFISRKLNLETVVVDGAREPLALAPHDVVYVPRSAIADANLWVKQHITDLIPIFKGVNMPLPIF